MSYVVEECDRYKFGDVTVQSYIRDLQPDTLRRLVPMKKGDWYNAKQVEDTVTSMTETAGLFGYAFAEINPEFRRNKDDLTMGLTFKVEDAPRVYVERSEEHKSELQALMRISYAVFCLKKKHRTYKQ